MKMDPDVNLAMTGLRSFMFKNVYTNKTAKSEEEKADRSSELFTYIIEIT